MIINEISMLVGAVIGGFAACHSAIDAPAPEEGEWVTVHQIMSLLKLFMPDQ
ncbi:hypothetical protein [Advenella sp. FME57]|uniref:hypothetical protein n=1 Tax=Advenella sp. FME57 TaxID=2742604 RepID=UPI0018688969|nr:hypothetical protein [Advenella sp. FME57]